MGIWRQGQKSVLGRRHSERWSDSRCMWKEEVAKLPDWVGVTGEGKRELKGVSKSFWSKQLVSSTCSFEMFLDTQEEIWRAVRWGSAVRGQFRDGSVHLEGMSPRGYLKP